MSDRTGGPSGSDPGPEPTSWFDQVFGDRDRREASEPEHQQAPEAAESAEARPERDPDPGPEPTVQIDTEHTAPLWTGWAAPGNDGPAAGPGPTSNDRSDDRWYEPGYGWPEPGRPGFTGPSGTGPQDASAYRETLGGFPLGTTPPGTTPLGTTPPVAPPPLAQPGRKRQSRPGLIILTAALVALLVGGGAGYGAARLGEHSVATDPTTSGSGRTPGPGQTAGPSQATAPSTARSVPGQADAVAVAKKVLPSTVTIRVSSATQQGGTGSGFVIDRSGRILTNNHVVSAAGDSGRLQVVLSDGSTTIARLVGRSPSYDLAVIQVDNGNELTPVQIGNSDDAQVGEPAIAIGSPLGLGGTVTEGIISAKNRPVAVNESTNADDPSAYIDALQTDAPINPGNSGGPLVDADGTVVGVNSAILTLGSSGQQQSGNIGLGFAIPINQAMEIGQLLIRDGKATYPVIGASTAPTTTDSGVLLQGVDAGQPAQQAGLQPGDLVTAIDDRPVREPEELIVAIRTHRPGDTVKLTYERNGAAATASVRLGSREG